MCTLVVGGLLYKLIWWRGLQVWGCARSKGLCRVRLVGRVCRAMGRLWAASHSISSNGLWSVVFCTAFMLTSYNAAHGRAVVKTPSCLLYSCLTVTTVYVECNWCICVKFLWLLRHTGLSVHACSVQLGAFAVICRIAARFAWISRLLGARLQDHFTNTCCRCLVCRAGNGLGWVAHHYGMVWFGWMLQKRLQDFAGS